MTSVGLSALACRRIRRVLAAVFLAAAVVSVGAPAASAHPLGNFTINYSSGIRVQPGEVLVSVVMDAAEIPTAQTFPSAGTELDGSAATAYRTKRCADLASAADLRLDGTRVGLTVTGSQLTFPPGAAGLPTTRLSCSLHSRAPVRPVDSTLSYGFPFETDRLGWREITATGDGVRLAASSVPAASPSQVLTAYPQDLLSSPLSVQDATMQVRAGSGVVTGAAVPGAATDPVTRGVDRLTSSYTDLIASHQLTLGFGLLAVVLAVVLGAMHAFAPGHGKALMAATLVGREGSLRQAVTIGLSVTITHSLGVLLLGLALTFTSLVAPERVYPWLGLMSGVLLVTIGTTLLRSAMSRHPHSTGAVTTLGVPAPAGLSRHADTDPHDQAHVHDHAHGVSHSHAPASHSHGLFSHSHEPAQLGTGSLLAVGFTGGLVPSPSALLVLLGGIALGRAWFGMVLVVAYGLGMAMALVAVGLALVKCKDWLERQSARLSLTGHNKTLAVTTRWLPAATSALVILIGLGVAARAASAI